MEHHISRPLCSVVYTDSLSVFSSFSIFFWLKKILAQYYYKQFPKKNRKNRKRNPKMGSGSRNLLCKSSSSALLFLAPSFTSAQLRFNSFTPSKLRRMATQPSSSPSSLTTNDTASPSPSPSPSSTIDFLSLCHRLKVRTENRNKSINVY